jgi:hypothetical protein
MSPGSQIRALTAKKATPKSATIRIGKRVERKKLKVKIVLNHSASIPEVRTQ